MESGANRILCHRNCKIQQYRENLCLYGLVQREYRVWRGTPASKATGKNRKAKWDFTFDTPFYIPVKKHELREFEICIKRDRDKDATELNNPMYLTLHFKQYPFF